MKAGQDELQTGVNGLVTGYTELNAGQDELHSEVSKIERTLNEHKQSVNKELVVSHLKFLSNKLLQWKKIQKRCTIFVLVVVGLLILFIPPKFNQDFVIVKFLGLSFLGVCIFFNRERLKFKISENYAKSKASKFAIKQCIVEKYKKFSVTWNETDCEFSVNEMKK